MSAAVVGVLVSLPAPPKRPEALLPPDCEGPSTGPECAPFESPNLDHTPEPAFDAPDASFGVLDTDSSLEGAR